MSNEESVSLYCVNDRSDKVYHVQLRKFGKSGFFIDTQFGRRGGKLNRGTTAPEVLPYLKAKKKWVFVICDCNELIAAHSLSSLLMLKCQHPIVFPS